MLLRLLCFCIPAPPPPQHLLESVLQLHPLPLLLVALLNRVMGISPEALLLRLQAKAASQGDPNPWLVQVRVGTHKALPCQIL